MARDIFNIIREFEKEMENFRSRFFDNAFRGLEDEQSLLEGPGSETNLPENYRKAFSDVTETDNEYIFNVELPGVNKEDIDVQVDNGYLVVSAESKKEDKDEKEGVKRYTRSYAGFHNAFKLGENVDDQNIEASYNNGILEIKVPKLEKKKEKGKKINIK